jgi:hypothetical protein
MHVLIGIRTHNPSERTKAFHSVDLATTVIVDG